MYALSKVAPCKITPENIQMPDTQVTLYQRSYRTFVNALMCRAKALVLRYNCGLWSHSSIVHNASVITYDLILSPEQCLQANKTGKLKVRKFGDEIDVDIKYGVSKVTYHNRGTKLNKKSPKPCDDRGQIKLYSFETLMKQGILDIDIKDRSIYNSQGQKFPCALSKNGCFSTSLEPFACNWEVPETCIVRKRLSQNAKTWKRTW